MTIDALTRGITIITGTDTDAGKTVATAVLAAALGEVTVVKPLQTGLAPGEEGDVQQVGRLAGLPDARCVEFVRLPEPLAPTTAARRAGIALPTVRELAERLVALHATADPMLVEGAGGILVGLDGEGRGLLELADALRDLGHTPRFVVVTRSGLGTLNHTGLTCDAIRARGHEVTGIVIGAWPEEPDLAERCNVEELAEAAGAPLLASIPAGLGDDPERVRVEGSALRTA